MNYNVSQPFKFTYKLKSYCEEEDQMKTQWLPSALEHTRIALRGLVGQMTTNNKSKHVPIDNNNVYKIKKMGPTLGKT